MESPIGEPDRSDCSTRFVSSTPRSLPTGPPAAKRTRKDPAVGGATTAEEIRELQKKALESQIEANQSIVYTNVRILIV